MTSKSARLLALSLDVKRVWPNRKYVYKPGEQIINWGCSTIPEWDINSSHIVSYLNHPMDVDIACNKAKSLMLMHLRGCSVPSFSTNIEHAREWGSVIVRHKLHGHSGVGIELVTDGELPDAPLYTKYIKSRHEYRIHIVGNMVIDVTKKRRRNETATDSVIRNHHTGWVYCRNNVVAPDHVIEQAIKAIKCLGLDFGAVDVIHSLNDDVAYVLEVNTAPGITGTTLIKYVNAFNKYPKLG